MARLSLAVSSVTACADTDAIIVTVSIAFAACVRTGCRQLCNIAEFSMYKLQPSRLRALCCHVMLHPLLHSVTSL